MVASDFKIRYVYNEIMINDRRKNSYRKDLNLELNYSESYI